MNLYSGTITAIESVDSLNLITINSNGTNLFSLMFEFDETLAVNKPVEIIFNDTEVSVTTCDPLAVSIANKIPATVMEVQKGGMLARLVLQSPIGEIHSVILSTTLDEMALHTGQTVGALIKATDIGLSVVK